MLSIDARTNKYFDELAASIQRWTSAWSRRPFVENSARIWTELPGLDEALLGLTGTEVETLRGNTTALASFLEQWFPGVRRLQELTRLPSFRNGGVRGPDETGIKARKVRQIEGFLSALSPYEGPFLEWCSGKAHLARTVASLSGITVQAIERDAELCRAGYELASSQGIEVRFHNLDVHSPAASTLLSGIHHVAALHACGQLHARLLEQAVAVSVPRISVAPCCFHSYTGRTYMPLSRAGARHSLRLDEQALRLATHDPVTGSKTRIEQDRHAKRWRLGFDLLQREVRGKDEYLPVPPLPKVLLRAGFEAFCREAGRRKGISLPASVDFDRYEMLGRRRMDAVDRLSLPRLLFRRPIETYLALDKCLSLSEAGYQVRVGTFCSYSDTPRNILIDARISG